MMIPQRAQASGNCGTHVVLAGQNLFRISLRYGVSLSTLAAVNGIYDVNRIYAGQVLTIPCGGSTRTTPVHPQSQVYTTAQTYYYAPATNNSAAHDNSYYPQQPQYNTYSHPTYTPPQYPVHSGQPALVDCTGFRASSPPDFPNGSIAFYWDPPRAGNFIARYQVRVFNAIGRQVAAAETFSPATSMVIDTSLGAIGPGVNFSYYVVGVTADNQICQTQTQRVRRDWTNTVDPR
jgi:LysM repeat protein